METEEIKNKSLKKALDILNCFSYKSTWGITELSDTLHLNKSNVYDIVTTLKAMDYLEQDDDTNRYRLGLQVFALSKAMADSFSIIRIAMPYMQELANVTNERVYLAIPHKEEIVYLEATYPKESVNLMRSILGERAPMYCTGLGKAILANMPVNYQEQCLKGKLLAFTDRTITDKRKLHEELKATKQRGYAIDNMEHEFGVRCVALPIFDKYGRICAGMSISGLAEHFTEKKIEEWALLGSKYARNIHDRL